MPDAKSLWFASANGRRAKPRESTVLSRAVGDGFGEVSGAGDSVAVVGVRSRLVSEGVSLMFRNRAGNSLDPGLSRCRSCPDDRAISHGRAKALDDRKRGTLSAEEDLRRSYQGIGAPCSRRCVGGIMRRAARSPLRWMGARRIRFRNGANPARHAARVSRHPEIGPLPSRVRSDPHHAR